MAKKSEKNAEVVDAAEAGKIGYAPLGGDRFRVWYRGKISADRARAIALGEASEDGEVPSATPLLTFEGKLADLLPFAAESFKLAASSALGQAYKGSEREFADLVDALPTTVSLDGAGTDAKRRITGAVHSAVGYTGRGAVSLDDGVAAMDDEARKAWLREQAAKYGVEL